MANVSTQTTYPLSRIGRAELDKAYRDTSDRIMRLLEQQGKLLAKVGETAALQRKLMQKVGETSASILALNENLDTLRAQKAARRAPGFTNSKG